MRTKGTPTKQKDEKIVKRKRGRPKKRPIESEGSSSKKSKTSKDDLDCDDPLSLEISHSSQSIMPDVNYSEGLHMSTMQVRALSSLVSCKDCGEAVVLGVRPTTKGMISEFTVACKVCGSNKSTNTPNLIRERKRKREKKGAILQKTENINYAHVAAFLDNGLGYSGLRHYCRYFNSRCLNEATFIVYARQVISDVITETEEFLQQNARIVRKAFETQLESDFIVDLTVSYTTTYHQWGSDFCLVAGAVIELQTGLVLDYDVANMYCHVCKINAKKIVSMSPSEMTEWFNKHQATCEIREWCDEIDQDSEEGVKEIDPKYLEAFIAKKLWGRSVEKFGFRYTTLIHESDERIHNELLKSAPYDDIPVLIDDMTNCFSRRKSEHARTSFQNKLKSKCPRERVQTKDRIMYVYAMSIPEYNKFAIGSNIKLRELVKRIDMEENPDSTLAMHVADMIYNTTEEGDEENVDFEKEGNQDYEEEEDEIGAQNESTEEEIAADNESVEGEISAENKTGEEKLPSPEKDVKPVIEKKETEKKVPGSKFSSQEIIDFEDDDENTVKNGTEESVKNKASESESVKPFRVDFDDD